MLVIVPIEPGVRVSPGVAVIEEAVPGGDPDFYPSFRTDKRVFSQVDRRGVPDSGEIHTAWDTTTPGPDFLFQEVFCPAAGPDREGVEEYLFEYTLCPGKGTNYIGNRLDLLIPGISPTFARIIVTADVWSGYHVEGSLEIQVPQDPLIDPPPDPGGSEIQVGGGPPAPKFRGGKVSVVVFESAFAGDYEPDSLEVHTSEGPDLEYHFKGYPVGNAVGPRVRLFTLSYLEPDEVVVHVGVGKFLDSSIPYEVPDPIDPPGDDDDVVYIPRELMVYRRIRLGVLQTIFKSASSIVVAHNLPPGYRVVDDREIKGITFTPLRNHPIRVYLSDGLQVDLVVSTYVFDHFEE